MAEKKILSIECEIPGGLSEFVGIDSGISLLDWDIVLFRPVISSLIGDSYSTYMGKTSLSDYHSFQLVERSEHWRREIYDALQAGKTIVVFLTELKEVYIDTGQRQHSGTGRNRQTTRLVTEYDNYRSLPFDVKPTNSQGSAMRLVQGAEVLSSYWSEFAKDSTYHVRLEGEVTKPLVVTKTGGKTVGALVRAQDAPGALLLLPYIELDSEEFYDETEEEWTEEGLQYGHRLLSAIIETDKALRESKNLTPTPEWAKNADYDLPEEAKFREKLLRVDKKLNELQRERQTLHEQMISAGRLRGLLYEKGDPLEEAILQSLILMGFDAKHYRDSESEFDVVFESQEGRFIGEAEGKDNKPVAIEKLRQLEMNIHEDLEKDEVAEPAKGVLFGNAFRLSPIKERGDFFTDKCLKAAKRSHTALVRTPDLFVIAQPESAQRFLLFLLLQT